jgi:isopentenyldiphosphate isomerase
MLDQEETLLVVDENNKPIGAKPRSEVHQKVLWHRSTHIWIINSKEQVLCQKRSLLKDKDPGMLSPFFGGHVGDDETEIENAVTELKEELGLKIKPSELKFYLAYRNHRQQPSPHYQYLYIYLLQWDGSLAELKPEIKEIDAVMWESKQAVLKNSFQIRNAGWTRAEYLPEFLKWQAKRL